MASNKTPSDDAAALGRVRNRLASTPDGKLPQILSKLLPRLLARFQTTTDDESVDPNLIGILEHVRERVLLNPKLLDRVWVDPLLKASVLPSEDMALGWTRQLQFTLPILELASATTTPDQSYLPQLMSVLERLHSVLPILWDEQGYQSTNAARRQQRQQQQADEDRRARIMRQMIRNRRRHGAPGNDGMELEERDNDEDEERQEEAEDQELNNDCQPNGERSLRLKDVWERASWMVVEQIALLSNLQPILDWNLLGDDWDDFHAASNLKKIQEYQPTKEEQSAASTGVMHLLLDALSFDPSRTAHRGHYDALQANSRWQFRRQVESIQADFEQAQRQRNAEHELARNNTQAQLIRRNVSSRVNPTEWNQAEIQYWRGIQQCLRSYAVKLFEDSTGGATAQPREGETILRILTGQPRPRSALPLYHRIKPSEMRHVNGRKRAKAAAKEEANTRCSLSEQLAFLHLIVGDAKARAMLDKLGQTQTTNSLKYLDVVGGSFDNAGSNHQRPSFMALRPLPPVLAQRVFAHLLQADPDLSAEKADNGTSLTLFGDFMHEIKDCPTLQTPVSSELYERIGAKTPPAMCWTVHFLWKLAKQLSCDRTDQWEVNLAERGYNSAMNLLNNLQDSAQQRFEREQRMAMLRDSHYRLISENRSNQANRHPFVTEALQARADAYQMVTRIITTDKLMGSGTVLSWDVAMKILNCMAFDNSGMTQTSLQQTAAKVLSLYRQQIQEVQIQTAKLPPINPLLLPLLKACIAASDWCRSAVVDWAVHVVFQVDPHISQTMLACLSSDDVPAVARKAADALRQLSFPAQLNASSGSLSFLNLANGNDRDLISGDLQSRIAILTSGGLSDKKARHVLQNYNFSLEAAHAGLIEDRKSAMAGPNTDSTHDEDAMDVDNDQDGMDLEETHDDIMCQVCWDEISEGKGLALDCKHNFCTDCWREGLEAAAASPAPQDLANFTCLRHDCNERLTSEEVKQIAPGLVGAMEDATRNMFVSKSTDYSFCPGPDCTAVACRPEASQQQQADCSFCSTPFCFGCGGEPHQPANCDVWRRYMTNSERVKAHQDAVEHKTINCPGCGVLIKKNGGCNHMTCRCGHEFCWICLSANWQDHVCNVFDNLNGVSDLERIQFFGRRVDAHVASRDATKGLLEDFDNQAQELQTRTRFCREEHLYILKEAWEMLVKGRNYLANSYIAAYGMPGDFPAADRHEFEAHQSQLQLFVEQLNFLSDRVPELYSGHREEDFQVRFRGFHFCTIAVAGYMQRVEECVGKMFRKTSAGVKSSQSPVQNLVEL